MGASGPVKYKLEKYGLKHVYYTGTDTLKPGYALCYDRDTITAENAAGTALAAISSSYGRHTWVEKPASGNLHNFAGIVGPGQQMMAGPCWVEIIQPQPGLVIDVFSDISCTANTTWLTVQPASYYIGGAGEGQIIGVALQTVDRSSTNGLVQAQLESINRLALPYGLAVPSSTVRTASAAIWETCPWDQIKNGAMIGQAYYNDFTNTYALAANQSATDLGDGVVGFTGATGGSIIRKEVTDEPYGVIEGESTTEDEQVVFVIGGRVNVMSEFVFSAATKLWMETRFKVSTVTAAKINAFVGFAEEALASAGGLQAAAGGALTDKDYVGWQVLQATPTVMGTLFNTAGGATTPLAIGATAATLAADTYVQIGLYSDGTTVSFYANGVVDGDSVLVAATDFPIDQGMALYYDLNLGSADTASLSIDWVRIAQLR